MPPDPTADVIGQVMRIMRYPVKSVGGEQVASADVSEDGILGDRAFGIVDAASGLLLSAHTVVLLAWARAHWREDGEAMIVLPDGSALGTEDDDVDERLSEWLDRRVRIERAVSSPGHIVESRTGGWQTSPGSFRDTMASLLLVDDDVVAVEMAGRANLIIGPLPDGPEAASLRKAWPGAVLDIGGIRVRLDPDVLRLDERRRSGSAIRPGTTAARVEARRGRPPGSRYAEVVGIGRLRPGDRVTLLT